MKYRHASYILALLLVSCSASSVVPPSQFTQEFADAVRKESPGTTVEVLGDLEVRLTNPSGREKTAFLHNAYKNYELDPTGKAEMIRLHVLATLEPVKAASTGIDVSRIVPLIKDRAWRAEVRQALLDRGKTPTDETAHEDFAGDLEIVYALDTPRNVEYLNAGDITRLAIEPARLRELACANLERILPPVQRHGEAGLCMLTAGGDYEASLLLIDWVWQDLPVKGDPVASVPNRDMLLVAGSEDPQALAKLKEISARAHAEGGHALTTSLFVRRNGRFEPYAN